MDASFNELGKKIFDNPNISEAEKNDFMRELAKLKIQKINLLITGATGCGKSSTINAMFGMEKAKVGTGVDPETMEIERYDLDNLVIWDSPGLGDGKEADNRHAKNIIAKLYEKDAEGNPLIDLVLVILDGSTRDLGTSYELINQVILPNIGEDKQNRVLVAINQADIAMKGKYWNEAQNRPEPELSDFLDEKAASVRRRVKEATGVDIEVIYYSAGWTDAKTGVQQKPYNLAKLFYYIVKYTPVKKRLVLAEHVNRDDEMWRKNDDLEDYSKKTQESMWETIISCAKKGSEIGEMLGIPGGKVIGGLVGGVIGGIVGFCSSLW